MAVDLYILSAGRTGTVFLEQLLATYAPEAVAEHEPTPTREQMMLANLRNDWGVGGGVLRRWFWSARARRLATAHGPYIEINPFLCAMTDLLKTEGRAIRVVHITRDPESWARSMTVFKASKKLRWIIDVIPFAKPYPSPRPKGWSRWSYYERNLARWVWCNDRIRQLRDEAEAYVHLRYEDLFGDDQEVREHAVREVFNTLGLACPEKIDWALFDKKANPAPPSKIAFKASQAHSFWRPLARELGYDC